MTVDVVSADMWPRCLHCDGKLVVSHLPGKVFLSLVMVLLLYTLLTSAAGAERHRKVLVLYDENTDFPGLALLDRNLKAALHAGATDRIDLYTESMDLARFQDDRYTELLYAFYRQKYANYQEWGKDDVRLHPDGTGPFKLGRWEQNQVIVFEKNPHYFKPGLPYLDRGELRVMKEGVTRVTALRAKEVDFANYIPREHVDRLTKDKQIQVLKGKDTQRVQSFFNLRKPVFQDVRVRKAILGHGIDRQAIAKTALLGQAQALWSCVPPGGLDHIDSGEELAYNPGKRRRDGGSHRPADLLAPPHQGPRLGPDP